jgi:hypothetical protein
MLVLREKVIMCCRKALNGAITPKLRAVTVDYNNMMMTFRAYFDKGAAETEKELINVAHTEATADLKKDIKNFNLEIVELPSPGKMKVLKDWVYRRAED